MSEPVWLEVSLVVDGELAEAVAEVLARFAPNGIAIESTAVTAAPDDTEGHEVGPLRVLAYLRMNADLEETRRRLEEALWYLGRIRPLPPAQFRTIKETDWAEAWKQHYHPIPIGKRLIIVPAWLDAPEQGRLPVRIDPGMAFGTGTHPSTQLCLEFIEELVPLLVKEQHSRESGVPGKVHVIDVGCGSGILSVAALKLGAGQALGVDIDPDAVKAAGENAAINAVAEHLELGTASLAEILAGAYSIRQAQLVLANILAPVLVRLLDEGLGMLLTSGGSLILSGIIDEQAEDVAAAALRNRLVLADRRQDGDWVALRVMHP